MRALPFSLMLILILPSAQARGSAEVSLFDAGGNPVAYIAPAENMTLYLWDGTPVAYLDLQKSNGPHVYGFNGKHLGWLASGIVWDHPGYATCALKEAMRSTRYEPYKSYKKYKPYRAYPEYPPYRPFLTYTWSGIPCALLLGNGQK